jgi:predicted DNA-binding protein
MQVQLATRLDAGLRQRLRIYAAVTGRTVTEVVSAALDGYLPTAEDMIRNADSGPSEDAFLVGQPEVA